MSSKTQRSKRRLRRHVLQPTKKPAKLSPLLEHFQSLTYQVPTFPRDRSLFRGEIPRTELPGLGHNMICPCCKNQDTTRVVDVIALHPFVEYYDGAAFKVFSCHCCGAIWHHKIEIQQQMGKAA
jgi:hypothetical protein